ncbi:MAG: hypothetical protein KatS3mg051_0797 [Anaerolineae bacterium]|nr:MAG: hypothetical protein KatS3mg051_0797 [Anaerolineae bacterium]
MPDARGYLLPAERQILLQRYAPVLVLFPELERQAPYPDEGDAIYTMRGSYHPRAVEFFLQEARLRYRPLFRLRHPGRWFRRRSLQEEIAEVSLSIGQEQIEKAAADYADDPRYAGLSADELRRAVRTRLIQQGLSQRLKGFDLPLGRGDNIAFWRHYFERLAQSAPDVRRCVVYGRLIQGRAPLDAQLSATEALLRQKPAQGPYDVRRSRVALQYWFHYYYDDWANRHEGDWETITILLELGEQVFAEARQLDETALLTGVQVLDVGYATHEDGYRRLWADVQKTTAGRPLVYVARGSSASYFAWEIEGYPASARVSLVEKVFALPGKLVRGRRIFGRRWDARFSARITGQDPKNVDWVAADPLAHDRHPSGPDNWLERLVPPPLSGGAAHPLYCSRCWSGRRDLSPGDGRSVLVGDGARIRGAMGAGIAAARRAGTQGARSAATRPRTGRNPPTGHPGNAHRARVANAQSGALGLGTRHPRTERRAEALAPQEPAPRGLLPPQCTGAYLHHVGLDSQGTSRSVAGRAGAVVAAGLPSATVSGAMAVPAAGSRARPFAGAQRPHVSPQVGAGTGTAYPLRSPAAGVEVG